MRVSGFTDTSGKICSLSRIKYIQVLGQERRQRPSAFTTRSGCFFQIDSRSMKVKPCVVQAAERARCVFSRQEVDISPRTMSSSWVEVMSISPRKKVFFLNVQVLKALSFRTRYRDHINVCPKRSSHPGDVCLVWPLPLDKTHSSGLRTILSVYISRLLQNPPMLWAPDDKKLRTLK